MYEERVVVFIDILGFKDLIYKSKENTDRIGEIVRVINKLHDLCGQTGMDDDPQNGFKYDRQVSVFSDNIVISYKEVGPALYYLVREAMVIQIALQYLGIFVRGGLTIGKLHHNGNTVIGPALISAYELESKTAIYPRIVADKSTQGDWCLLAKDFDGIYFLDYLGNIEEWEYFLEHTEKVTVEECLKKLYLSALIENNNLDLRIRAKHDWMRKYIFESIRCFENAYEVARINKTLYTR